MQKKHIVSVVIVIGFILSTLALFYRPNWHDKNWMKEHGAVYKRVQSGNYEQKECLSCHEKKFNHTKSNFCNKCHEAKGVKKI